MKMAEQERDPLLIAPCGMDCMVCYRHCACKKPCEGCRSSGQNKPGHCRKCEIKNCAAEKGLVYCAECPGYPCRKLENLEKLYTRRYGISLMEQGRFVRACGEAAFLDRERTRYACPACGGVVSLHDAQCSECGLGWKLPEC